MCGETERFMRREEAEALLAIRDWAHAEWERDHPLVVIDELSPFTETTYAKLAEVFDGRR